MSDDSFKDFLSENLKEIQADVAVLQHRHHIALRRTKELEAKLEAIRELGGRYSFPYELTRILEGKADG